MSRRVVWSAVLSLALGAFTCLASESDDWGAEQYGYSGVTEKGPFNYSITRLVHSGGSCVVLVCEGAGGRGQVRSQSGPVMSGRLFAADGREVEYTCDRRPWKAGEFRCAGKVYPLADGALFLIDVRGGKTVIEQVPVAGNRFPAGEVREKLGEMAKTNERLGRILQSSEPTK